MITKVSYATFQRSAALISLGMLCFLSISLITLFSQLKLPRCSILQPFQIHLLLLPFRRSMFGIQDHHPLLHHPDHFPLADCVNRYCIRPGPHLLEYFFSLLLTWVFSKHTGGLNIIEHFLCCFFQTLTTF